MKKMIISTIAFAFMVMSCEKEYFPDENDYRDQALIGTWIYRSVNSQDSVIMVYTKEGYYDVVNPIYVKDIPGFSNLGGIWHVTKKIEGNSELGEIYSRSTSSNLSTRGWEHYQDYKLSNNNDSLFIKEKNQDSFEIYTKFYLQLNYDGPKYIDLDTIN
jgi:hypothetical protein